FLRGSADGRNSVDQTAHTAAIDISTRTHIWRVRVLQFLYCPNFERAVALKGAVVGDFDLTVDDLLLDAVDLVDQRRRDQGFVVLVEGEVDAVLGQAEVLRAA